MGLMQSLSFCSHTHMDMVGLIYREESVLTGYKKMLMLASLFKNAF